MSMSPEPRRSRHRAADQTTAPVDDAAEDALEDDGDLDSYLAALAPGAGDDPTELTGRFGSAQVFQLRLPGLRIEQLRRLAGERGVSPGSLAVDWVIDRLDREDTPTGPLPVADGGEAAVEVGTLPRRRGLRGRLGLR